MSEKRPTASPTPGSQPPPPPAANPAAPLARPDAAAAAPAAGMPIPDEVMRALPPEARGTLMAFSASVEQRRVMHPLVEKMDASHVTQILQNMDKSEEREFKDRGYGRRYHTFYALLGVGVVVFVVLLFRGNPPIIETILKVALGFLGGLGTGVTYVSLKNRGK